MKRDVLNVSALIAGVLVLALGGPVVVRLLRSLPAATLAARSGERIVTLEVSGMSCPGCASAVQERIAAVDGVSAVTVRFAQRRAYVVCALDVPDSALVAAVGKAGPGFSAALAAR